MISENIKKIKNTIHECCKNCNKDPEEIILIGASKSQSISSIKEALNSGLTHFGENYVGTQNNLHRILYKKCSTP